ncbi:MAG TPA: copper-binding protein [Anaeromyxobacteraceae bacterium]|nr:copper-binding protein [Anaeromyxobacteraceae bacterium]
MSKHAVGALAGIAALMAGPAWASSASADKQAMAKPEVPSFQMSHEETVTGTIEAIDKKASTVTLRGPENTVTFKVRDRANLKKAKVGDQVVAKYHESLSGHVKQPGEEAPKKEVTESETSQQGQPGRTAARKVTATVLITAIDQKAGTLTVKGPEGNSLTVKARDPKNLKKVKVGDELVVTYTEALAVSLKPAPK